MSFHIQSAQLKNYGNLPEFNSDHFSDLNLIIGENATGKTFLLKSLYSAVRAMEDYKRGDDIRPMGDILSDKLRWTFQADKLGDLVTRSAAEGLSFKMQSDQKDMTLEYQFSQSAASKVGSNIVVPAAQKPGNSIFLPAKEVLSLFSIILKSREVDKSFGFDDTYYDLVKALQIAPSKGKNYSAFATARKELNRVVDGKVDYDEHSGKWYYKNSSGQKFSIGATAEGVKKISIMDRLLANGFLSKDSVIFIDELESALHPTAICEFLDMLADVSKEMGIQVFISTHSYFVIKKMYLIALRQPKAVTCISLSRKNAPLVCNLYDGMPDNSIIQTSIKLYEQEIDEEL